MTQVSITMKEQHLIISSAQNLLDSSLAIVIYCIYVQEQISIDKRLLKPSSLSDMKDYYR